MKINIIRAAFVGALLPAAALFHASAVTGQVAQEGEAAEATQVRRITLEEALALLESNLDLRLARAVAREAEGLVRQANAYPNPAFTTSHETLSESGLDLSESYFTLSQRIEWPGARSARQSAVSERAGAARFDVLADRARLTFEVKRAYVEAARAGRGAELLERVTVVFRRAEESAGERYEEGDVSLFDLRRIEVERLRYEAALADAVLDLGEARRNLGLLVAPEAESLELAPADEPAGLPPSLDLSLMADVGPAERPEIASADAALNAVRAELSETRAQRIPDVTANGGFKRQSDGFSGVFLGVSVPVPLWNRSGGAIEAGQARVAGAETRLAQTRRQVGIDVRRTRNAYQSQLRRAELLGQVTREPEVDLLAVAQVAYEAGEMDLIALLDAAEAYLGAETAALRIRSEVWTSYYDLERAVGGFDDLLGQEEE